MIDRIHTKFIKNFIIIVGLRARPHGLIITAAYRKIVQCPDEQVQPWNFLTELIGISK